MKRWKIYGIWILTAELVGFLSGMLSREGMNRFEADVVKPALSPPNLVFILVWIVLYALMGIGAARVWLSPQEGQKRRGLNLYIAQLIVNFFWPLIFFNGQAFGFAAVWLALLWVLVLGMILKFRKTDPIAAWLQLPYLLWLTFAFWLNVSVWMLNK